MNWDRLAVLQGWPLVATVIVAITLRKVLTGFKLSERSWRWAALVAYLEAVWVVILARYFEAQLRDIHSWVASRAVVVSLIHVKDQLIGLLGPLAPLVHHALGWLSEHFGSMGELLVIPVAWLAIGATISGTELPDAPDQLPVTFGAAQRERYTQRIAKIPSGVRRAAARIADPVVSPFQEVWESLRRLSVAGLVPMVLFCVIFVLASRIQVLMAWLGRWVVGPQSQRDQLMWQSYLSLVERTVYTVVIVALLSAAIRAIVGSPAGADDPSTEPPVRRAEVIAPGVAG